jgi:hypothetical protein
MYQDVVRRLKKVLIVVVCLFVAVWVVYRGQRMDEIETQSLMPSLMTIACGMCLFLTAIAFAFGKGEEAGNH